MSSSSPAPIVLAEAPNLGALNDCGCCAGTTVQTPVEITNRPGLNALIYRVGTYARFRDSMLARLSSSANPALANLRTREDDDPTIALIDAWSAVSDILTFYQERIANEAYLRTATERRSILEMARLIGYELSPGVAAGAYLAFTLDTAAGAGQTVTIDIGTKVQSVPAPGQKPQTFETIEPITGHTEWNAFLAQSMEIKTPKQGDTSAVFAGLNNNLKAGDMLLFVDAASIKSDPPAYLWDFQRITKATPQKESGTTLVEWENGLNSDSSRPAVTNPVIYVLRQRAALFGANAPDWRSMADNVKKQYPMHSATGLQGDYYSDKDLGTWVYSRIDSILDFSFDSTNLPAGIGPTNFSVRWTGSILAPATGTYTFTTTSDDGVNLWISGKSVILNWTDQDGSWSPTGTIDLEAGKYYDLRIEYYQNGGGAQLHFKWTVPNSGSTDAMAVPATNLFNGQTNDEWPDFNAAYQTPMPSSLSQISLDNHYPQIVGSASSPATQDQYKWALLATSSQSQLYSIVSVADGSQSNFALSSKTTDLTFDGDGIPWVFGTALREIVVYAQSELLSIASTPIKNPITGNTINLMGAPTNALVPGQMLSVSGVDSTGKSLSEVVAVASISDKTLVVIPPLQYSYQAASLVINANVARATHGETVLPEVLGNGDASQSFQQFALKQSPLTYTSTASATGAESSLQIFVNDIEWHEQPFFYGLTPQDRAFTSRIDDDGNTTVKFGDGATGARLPTGSANIVAKYRKGIGLPGMVSAGQLTTLLKRPAGVKSAVNPLDATGAADAETLADARSNATLKVLTFDRVVSLQDYEDFARAFTGIAKAFSTWTWDGQVRGVFLTVAGPEGDPVPPESEVYNNLVGALQNQGDPYVQLNVASYTPATFTLSVNLQIDSDYQPPLVTAQVAQALRDAFSFDARSFGQSVALSEAYEVIEKVPGVVASDITEFYRLGEDAALNTLLAAAYPVAGSSGTVAPAELLTLDPGPFQIGIMK